MSRRVVVTDRIVAGIGVAVPVLRVRRGRNNGIRLDEVVDIRRIRQFSIRKKRKDVKVLLILFPYTRRIHFLFAKKKVELRITSLPINSEFAFS